jgi:hypothetical protein
MFNSSAQSQDRVVAVVEDSVDNVQSALRKVANA